MHSLVTIYFEHNKLFCPQWDRTEEGDCPDDNIIVSDCYQITVHFLQKKTFSIAGIEPAIASMINIFESGATLIFSHPSTKYLSLSHILYCSNLLTFNKVNICIFILTIQPSRYPTSVSCLLSFNQLFYLGESKAT